MLVASRYKIACKVLFGVQVIINFLVVALGVVERHLVEGDDSRSAADVAARAEASNILVQVVFAVSLVVSTIVSIDGLYAPLCLEPRPLLSHCRS